MIESIEELNASTEREESRWSFLQLYSYISEAAKREEHVKI